MDRILFSALNAFAAPMNVKNNASTQEYRATVVREVVALIAIELANLRWFGGVGSHLLEGNAIRDRRNQGVAGVLKADEAAIEKMIDGGGGGGGGGKEPLPAAVVPSLVDSRHGLMWLATR